MSEALKIAAGLILLGVIVYFGLDAWQASVHVYASGCETESGHELSKSMCRYIVNYRYQKGD
ncbi:MAG: hypothetical protein EHM62_08505 [Methylococcus sp.]|nr:MAG: hypothetical protein EHM62_08505 [Methylococcus sp.]